MEIAINETLVDDSRDQTVLVAAHCTACAREMLSRYDVRTLQIMRVCLWCRCGRPMRLTSCEIMHRNRMIKRVRWD